MPRLHRPHIPLSARIVVLERQLGYEVRDTSLAARVDRALVMLAMRFGCDASEMRLDHNPALALRKRRGTGKATVYSPAANDPDYLEYRSSAGHDTKTRIRGDRGQFSDLALIRREKRRKAKTKEQIGGIRRHKGDSKLSDWARIIAGKPKQKIRSRGFDKTRSRGFDGKVRQK